MEKRDSKKEKSEKTVVYSEVTKADSKAVQLAKKALTISFVVFFIGTCLWQTISMQQKSEELDQTIAQLEEQIEEEKEKQLDIKVEQDYYQSDQYKEQMARDRCKLIYPGEILINIQK